MVAVSGYIGSKERAPRGLGELVVPGGSRDILLLVRLISRVLFFRSPFAGKLSFPLPEPASLPNSPHLRIPNHRAR